MQLSDFDFDLPERLIAQTPLAERSASRLLVVDPIQQALSDREFVDLAGFLRAGDLLVFNDTRVIPARLHGRKASGGKVEVMVERVLDDNQLLAHVRASKAPKPGGALLLEDAIECTMLERRQDLFLLQQQQGRWLELLERYGHVPLPPYIQRADAVADRQRYQTVYARSPGAVAAPTAGLHFDAGQINHLRSRGVEMSYVTLHVGAGTFQPLREDQLERGELHAEYIEVSQRVCDQIADTRSLGGRIVAVGTTVMRALETAALDGELSPFSGDSRLFIRPGFEFRVADALLTNFHLPGSSLLMLVGAFAGSDTIMAAYRHAIEQQYRFYSYGDAMFCWRHHGF